MAKQRNQKFAPKTRRPGPLVVHADLEGATAKQWQLHEQELEKLKRLEALRERFEIDDLPAYQGWLLQFFSKELEEIDSLTDRMEDLETIIESIGEFRSFHGGSFAQVAEKVMRIFEKGREEFQDFLTGLDDRREQSDAVYRQAMRIIQGEGTFDDEFEEDFDLEDADEEGDLHDDDGIDRPAFRSSSKPSADISGGKIKELYLALVRRLHPDTLGSSPQDRHKTKLWHDLQVAYGKSDVLAMVSIQSVLDGTAIDSTEKPQLSPGEIHALREDIQLRIKHLKDEVDALKDEEPWDFKAKSKDAKYLKRLQKSTRSTIDEQLFYYRFKASELEEALVRLRTPKTRKKNQPKDKEPSKPARKPSKAKKKTTKKS